MTKGDFLKSILLLPVVGEVLMKPKVFTPKYGAGIWEQLPKDLHIPYIQLTEERINRYMEDFVKVFETMEQDGIIKPYIVLRNEGVFIEHKSKQRGKI